MQYWKKEEEKGGRISSKLWIINPEIKTDGYLQLPGALT